MATDNHLRAKRQHHAPQLLDFDDEAENEKNIAVKIALQDQQSKYDALDTKYQNLKVSSNARILELEQALSTQQAAFQNEKAGLKFELAASRSELTELKAETAMGMDNIKTAITELFILKAHLQQVNGRLKRELEAQQTRMKCVIEENAEMRAQLEEQAENAKWEIASLIQEVDVLNEELRKGPSELKRTTHGNRKRRFEALSVDSSNQPRLSVKENGFIAYLDKCLKYLATFGVVSATDSRGIGRLRNDKEHFIKIMKDKLTEYDQAYLLF